MKKSLFFAALASVALASCSSEDVIMQIENPTQQSENAAIGFKTYTGGTTRASVASNVNTGFGVSAILVNTTNGESLFMNDEKVYDNSGWTYDNTKYWPKDKANNTIDFYFYAPHSSLTNSNVSNVTVTPGASRAVTIDFAVAATVANQSDLLWAPAVTGATSATDNDGSGNNTVKAAFQHVLSKIGFTAIPTTPSITIQVNSVKIAGSMNDSGTLNLATGAWASVATTGTAQAPLEFEPVLVGGSYVTLATAADLSGVQPTRLNADTDYIMVVPTAAASYDITIDYDVIDSNSVATNNVITVTTGSIAFEKGKGYTFNLNIGADTISFDASVDPWTETTPTDVNVQ